MGLADCCSKTILYAVNIVFILGGIAILGGGIYLKVDPSLSSLAEKAPQEITDVLTSLSSGAIILIVFGCCVLLVAVCGCCGVMQENQCFLGIYIFFVALVIIAELAAGIFIYVQKDQIETVIKTPFVSYLQEDFFKTSGNNLSDVSYIYIMQTLSCCGWDSEADFKSNTVQPRTVSGHPIVCCKLDDWEQKGKAMVPENPVKCDAGDAEFFFQKGCKQSFLDTVSSYLTIAIAIGASVAGLELIVLISAICFCCRIRSDD